MGSISSWVLSIVGIVFIGVLVDVILPEGQMNKYVKSIFALVVVFVIISPIAKMINTDHSVDLFDKYELSLDLDFLQNYNNSLKEKLEIEIINEAKAQGIDNILVEIVLKEEKGEEIIEKIIVDISNIVILENGGHINEYTKINDIIEKHTGVKEDKIIFYE